MSTMTVEELTDLGRALDAKVKQLEAPYEAALSHRVFEDVQKTFRAWLAVWLGVVSVVGALVGFLGYREVAAAGQKAVSEQVAKQVAAALTSKLEDAIREETQKMGAEARKRLNEGLERDFRKLDADIALLSSQAQTSMEGRIKELAERLAKTVKDPTLATTLAAQAPRGKLSGYAYFGVRLSDGTWQEQNFAVVGNESAIPKVDDVVTVRRPVNVREGMIELTSRGWENKAIVGLARKEEQYRVAEVSPIGGAVYWIRVVPKT